PIPLIPSRRTRSFHLWPVFVLIPYSWHKARKFTAPSAFNPNSIRSCIGSLFFHGMLWLLHHRSLKMLPMYSTFCATYVLNLNQVSEVMMFSTMRSVNAEIVR